MRLFWACIVLLSSIAFSHGLAQEKLSPIPPRFNALAKNDRFRLVGVLGSPELPTTYPSVSAISADGRCATYVENLSSGDDKQTHLRSRLLVWDLPPKRWPREIELAGKYVSALALSADGGNALVAGLVMVEKEKDPRAYVSLWDLKAGKEIKAIVTKDHDFQFALAFSPDNTTALFGSLSHLKQWNLKQGQIKELARFGKDEIGVTKLEFLPGGKQFLSISGVGIQLWDLNNTKPVRTYADKKKDRHAVDLSVSRDGKRLVTSHIWGSESSLILWETETGKQINEIKLNDGKNNEGVAGIALADDGKTVLASHTPLGHVQSEFSLLTTRLTAWDGANNKIKWSQTVDYRGPVPMLIQGDKLLIGGGPNWLDTWDIKSGKMLASLGGHKGVVNALATLANGDILSTGQEGIVMTWRQGEITSKRSAHAGAVSVLTLSPDRKQWLSAGADQLIKLWSADAEKPVHVFKGHSGYVTSLAFANKERWAASGSGDRSVKTWNLATGKEIATFVGHSESVAGIAISPDGSWLASASDDGTIRLWPVNAGKLDPDREAITLEDHKKAVTCLAFSPDGKTLLSGSQDKTLIVWDWRKGKATRTIPGHKNWITSLLFVDAHTAVSTSDDLTLCWWDVNTGKEIGRVDFGAVGDCPRCLAHAGPDRLLVGSSSWLIYELQMLPTAKTKKAAGSSK